MRKDALYTVCSWLELNGDRQTKQQQQNTTIRQAANLSFLPPALTQEQGKALCRALSEARLHISGLCQELRDSPIREALSELLLLDEAVNSVRIEGTDISVFDLFNPLLCKEKAAEIQEVRNYRAALQQGLAWIKEGRPFSSDMIVRLHQILMNKAPGAAGLYAGKYRTVQNFIGPDSDIRHAVYVPVAADRMPAYMENLTAYMNGKQDSHCLQEQSADTESFVVDAQADPLLKLAVMHAQFESVHPFIDGNGRLGRILLTLMAYRYGPEQGAPVFLLSSMLEKSRYGYYESLQDLRRKKNGWFNWLMFFVQCSQTMAMEQRVKIQYASQEAQKGCSLCQSAAEQKIWLQTFSTPAATAVQTAQKAGVSPATARKYLRTLVQKNLLRATASKHNQLFINEALLQILP